MTVASAPDAPVDDAARVRRVAAPVVTVAGLAVASVALALRDPHRSGSWGLCPSQMLGFDCPGCGGLRAVNDLTHARFLDAASSNLYLVVAIPVVVFLLGRWALDAWRGVERGPSALTTPLLVIAGLMLVAFTVLRNLAPFGFLAS